MKKTLISAIILVALFTTGCQDKESQAKIEQQLQTIAQLTAKNSQLKTELEAAQSQAAQALPAIFVQPDVIFAADETLQFPKGTDTLSGDKGELHYSVTTLKTNLDWLDSLLLQQLSLAGKNQLRSKAQVQEEYQQAFAQTRAEMMKEPVFRTDQKTWLAFVGQREKLATFIRSDYGFTGGAHGFVSNQYLNIDLTTHKILTLDDVFGGNVEQVKTLLWQHYSEGKTETFTAKADFNVSPQFYFDLNGVHFYYDQYELASYSEGQQELFLWWNEVWDLLAPSFKNANYFPQPEMIE